MKKLLPFYFLLLCKISFAQNLVPNPSFEDTISCPISTNQVNKAEFWYSFRESPEYLNVCNNQINGIVGVPTYAWGYQYPHSGNAYAGMISYDLTGAPYREYIAVLLTSPTITNQKYFITFYINWNGTIGFTLAHNKIGISLSNSLYSELNPFPITNNPKAYSDSIYQDSVLWSKVQLSFIADSAYQYLIIGNFYDDANTDTLNLGQFNLHCYYLIDDVCLSTDSVYCSNFTAMQELNYNSNNSIIEKYLTNENKIKIYFNSAFFEKTLFVYSSTGQIIKNSIKTKAREIELDLPITNSLYFIKIFENNKTQSIKILTFQN